MKIWTLKLVRFGILSTILCFAPALQAKEQNSNLKVVYVSISQALEKTGEQAKIQQALEKEQKRIQELIRKKSESFNKSAMKIQKEVALLSDAEKAKKYEEIQKMRLTMEQFVKSKEIEFQKKEANLKEGAIKRIRQAVESVAKAEKVDVIRNKDGTLWVHPKWDVTDKVVSRYKRQFKK